MILDFIFVELNYTDEMVSRMEVITVESKSDAPELVNAKSCVSIDDVVICMIDEWKDGKKSPFDCHILSIEENGIDTLYLSGFRSRNDFVSWQDIIAKFDMSFPWVQLDQGFGFSGHFQVFKSKNEYEGADLGSS